MSGGRRCVIIGGAGISDYEFARGCIREDDYVIYCDSGLKHMEALGARPSLIVGDFDSHEDPQMDVETITLPVAKDDTDTVFAARTGIERGYRDFLLLGAIGARFDHSLVNVYILTRLADSGCRGEIIDDYSEMELICAGETARVPDSYPFFSLVALEGPAEGVSRVPDSYPFFSLVALEGPAEGVSISGAKFCLKDAQIGPEYQYATSNEALPGTEAEISVKEGRLLLIKDRI